MLTIPATPEKAYRDILENRITEDDKPFAKRILSWVFYARRTLTMPELQEALAVQTGELSLNRLNISYSADIIHACGSLLDHNRTTDNVSFSHELVRKYVEDHQSEILLGQSEIALGCLTYLSFPVFNEPCDFDNLSSRLREFAFSQYASTFWAEHVKGAEKRNIDVEIAAFDAFSSEARCYSIDQVRSFSPYDTKAVKNLFHIVAETGIGFILTLPLSDERITSG
jgi:hypothetical protein